MGKGPISCFFGDKVFIRVFRSRWLTEYFSVPLHAIQTMKKLQDQRLQNPVVGYFFLFCIRAFRVPTFVEVHCLKAHRKAAPIGFRAEDRIPIAVKRD